MEIQKGTLYRKMAKYELTSGHCLSLEEEYSHSVH
jgi:hypothetical protein